MPKTRESKIRANAKYDSTHCTGLYLKFNNGTDSDILEKLSSVPNRQGYIKSLIRQDIVRTRSVPDVAHWIKKSGDALYCSKCNMPSINKQPYCCGCGSKMSDEVI